MLLDVMMPGELDGLQVCHRIKSDPATAHIAWCCSPPAARRATARRARDAGADEYLVKPFSPLQLIE
jgi:two-component system phosphate regulon response regulator PhoB